MTYLLHGCLQICGPSAFKDPHHSELFESVRNGIQERIQKIGGEEQKDQYDQGLLIWKLYIEALQLEEEFNEADHDESIDFTKITPESVFKDFKDEVQEKRGIQRELRDDSDGKEEVKRPIEIMKDVDSDDEDDGDFKVRYKSLPDDYSDLKKLQDKPLFISDLIQGLRSEDHNRFNNALENAEGLIRG